MKKIISLLLVLTLFMGAFINVNVSAGDAFDKVKTQARNIPEEETKIMVPYVVGTDVSSATSSIAALGLFTEKISISTTDINLDGIVTSTSPAGGEMVDDSSFVTIYFYRYDDLVIPEESEPETIKPETTEPEIIVPETTEPETTEPEIIVPETTEPETTEPGTTEPETTEPEITEPETTEPEITVTVPSVAGMNAGSAISVILSAGLFTASVSVTTNDVSLDGMVKSTFPGAGEEVIQGSAVTVYVYRYEAQVNLKKPDVTGVENAVGGIKVNWKTVKNAKKYEVLRKESKNGKYKVIKTTTKNSYTDKTTVNGKTYYYTVRAVNGGSKSGYESGMSLKYVAVPKISSVKNLSTGLKVTWKTVKGATSYKVYRLEKGEKEWDLVGTVKKTTFTDTDVVAYEKYTYSVRAVNGKMSALDKTGSSKEFVPSGKWSKQVAFNFYENAIDKAEDLKPGYQLKTWQNIDYSKSTGKNQTFANEFNSIMKSAFYPKSKPLTYKCKKGTEDSEELFPDCDAKLNKIKSITTSKNGKYIVVKIVMKDENSPEKNKGGIKDMSDNYFDLNGIVKEFKNEGMITKGTSSSTYKNFTITAKIKTNGQIVSMNHSCENIKMSMNMNFINGIGNIKYSSQIDSYLTYTNFKY